MTSHIRHRRFREKYRQDKNHIKYLIEKGWHPLDIADQMTQYTIIMLKEGIHKRHPEWTSEEILTEMRRLVLLYSKMHKRRGVSFNGRT
ncbi:hypothetical protein DSAG12_01795 [Promethearchaeum syntrophicum]|uniref:Uncharacterized protein n=1 Tax=Promethearchaeum syntrophicum TaxID=2594042 RepID=A0A5B9DAW5_9ARCH|nr:hypothetical protein [Candidatus Prometheoarchaeum syntrophicum]QEE15967.1 hypothetical protein DSAG12_01795 [Candidatus Prometheoarchaeum syntrophicum]